MSAPSNQMSLEEILRQIQYYERQAESLEQQIRSLDQIVLQYTLVRQTFKDLSPVSAGNEILIPISLSPLFLSRVSYRLTLHQRAYLWHFPKCYRYAHGHTERNRPDFQEIVF